MTSSSPKRDPYPHLPTLPATPSHHTSACALFAATAPLHSAPCPFGVRTPNPSHNPDQVAILREWPTADQLVGAVAIVLGLLCVVASLREGVRPTSKPALLPTLQPGLQPLVDPEETGD